MATITKLTDEKFLNMVAVDYKDKNGKDKRWVYATRNDVADLPCVKDNAVHIAASVNEKLCIIREFRPALNCYVYALPAGLIDAGEKLEETVARELREETGLECQEITYLSPPLAPSPGAMDEIVRFVLVRAEGKITNKNATEDEDIEVELADYSRVKQILDGTDPISAPALSALLAYAADKELIMEKQGISV